MAASAEIKLDPESTAVLSKLAEAVAQSRMLPCGESLNGLVVWKYRVRPGRIIKHEIPAPAAPVFVDFQESSPVVWCLVNPVAGVPLVEKSFLAVGTGQALPDKGMVCYVGSINATPFVWHIFEVESG